MKRLLATLLLATVCLPQSGCIFGQAERCTETSPSSFSTFREEQWTTYCVAYKAHIEQPFQYSLVELTEFLASHPARVKELDATLESFEKYETCFATPKEELELRELETCLQDNDKSDLEIINAWTTAAEPWLEELDFKVGALKPMLDEAESEGDRLFKKTTDAFAYHARLDDAAFLAFSAQIDDIEKSLEALDTAAKRYEDLLAAAKPNDALTATLTKEVGPRVTEVNAQARDLRERAEVLETGRRFLERATYAVGVPCPSGIKSREEERVAKSVAGGRNNEVGGSGVRIETKIESEEDGDTDIEQFTGFICGVRARENQFEGAPKLCGQYEFVIARTKSADADKWGAWSLKTFEEAGPKGGVDCAMITGALPVKRKRAPVDDGY